MADSRVFAFGPFHYDAEQRLLFRQDEVVPLVPKAIDTLHVLLERRGRVVEKADLMKLVWPDTTVEDVGLARNISLLRKALDDESGQYIETIPRRGYRFVAETANQGPEVGGQGSGETSVARGCCRRRRGAGRNCLLAVLRAFKIPAARGGDRQPGGGPV
jgi:DNA-binding winged helix-turn-helix (wHTH) protein